MFLVHEAIPFFPLIFVVSNKKFLTVTKFNFVST